MNSDRLSPVQRKFYTNENRKMKVQLGNYLISDYDQKVAEQEKKAKEAAVSKKKQAEKKQVIQTERLISWYRDFYLVKFLQSQIPKESYRDWRWVHSQQERARAEDASDRLQILGLLNLEQL